MSDEVKLLPCEMQAVKHLKQCAKDAANSGSYFNQGVVRGLEIAAAQIEHGHHRTRAIEATRPTEQGLGVPTSVPNAALAGADGGSPDVQGADRMTAKREKPLALDMPFDEALDRFIGTKPTELPDSVKLKRKKPPPKRGPGVARKPSASD